MKSIEIDRSKRLNERIANSRVLRQRSPSSWPPPPRHKRLESDADAAGAELRCDGRRFQGIAATRIANVSSCFSPKYVKLWSMPHRSAAADLIVLTLRRVFLRLGASSLNPAGTS
jgi:hypothetical protein